MLRKDLKITLLYPPEQNWPDTMCKPNGSLAYPMLAGALRDFGINVQIYDACVGGDDKDNLKEIFYKSTELDNGMLRTGVSDERILEVISDSDAIGLTSIFSHQETMVLRTAKLIKKHFPKKLILSGGVNARSRSKKFFEAGIDLICTSESEKTIIDIAEVLLKNSRDFSHIPQVMFMNGDKEVFTGNKMIMRKGKPATDIIWDLDELPIPAWDLLPNDRYWEIGRPHGGHFNDDEELKYASMMTSLGCPFHCSYCHISGEGLESTAGQIGSYRIKSDDRVLEEMQVLKDLGVRQVFVEDDSLLGMKKRAIRLVEKIKKFGLEILDVNGVNIIHLLKHNKAEKGEPDYEVLQLLKDAGFREIVLPFESATPRIIKKYASSKWNIEQSNMPGLIKACKEVGFRIAGNFMLGYPDETRNEIMYTIQYAKDRMIDGLDSANFFLVMPLPGTQLFDEATAKGHLPKDFNPDKMHWQKANMMNTEVPPEELEEIRDKAWQETNKPEFTNYKKNMRIEDDNTGEIHTKK